MPADKKVLLSLSDGPEGIEIYTSEEAAIVEWSSDIPSLYISVTVDGAYVRLGPFHMKSIREGIERVLDHTAAVEAERRGCAEIVESLRSGPHISMRNDAIIDRCKAAILARGGG